MSVISTSARNKNLGPFVTHSVFLNTIPFFTSFTIFPIELFMNNDIKKNCNITCCTLFCIRF